MSVRVWLFTQKYLVNHEGFIKFVKALRETIQQCTRHEEAFIEPLIYDSIA